ncbi:hypothetical protein [Streptomyces sp. H27-D2]|uniref:hypothetical protein n=1 Tax=Streptomyces sp. H27-D2 TaxID=3046304 RepID=UPI002DB7E9DF|nr:hypothetical protein [Streptomyces sp. H27-D2]MEC4018012.1 hypothetical protein [Streptomyces sp. H27-D2]
MLIARSSLEAHLYMDLHACECGAVSFDRQHHLEQRGDAMVAVYEGVCPECGRARSFSFQMTDELPPPPPAFGGSNPSLIVDPGEFLLVSYRIATDTGLRLLNTPKAERRKYRAATEYGLAALEEVLKFIPEGQDVVPPSAFTSERGRALYEKEPGKFARDLLENGVLATRQILAGIDRVSPPLS